MTLSEIQFKPESRRRRRRQLASVGEPRAPGAIRRSWLGVLTWWLAAALPAFAQVPLSNLVVTVGTTIQTNSTTWSYVLIGAPQAGLLAGKQFAVYGKPGYPTNAASFTLRGMMFQRTDQTDINNLLNQSLALGENLTTLGETMDTLLHNVPGITNYSLPQKILAAFQVANADPETAQILYLLAHVHPGLNLCSGQAFSETVSTVTTYEVREVNPATGGAGAVVGRVTVTPGAPVVLPAPGYPYQVLTNDPSDHLRIRLRWGTPPELRRLSLLSYGFNVWRIPTNEFVVEGYNLNPPTTPQQLRNDPYITQVNNAPIMASKEFNTGHGAGAADDPADRTTYFFSDDNGHAMGRVHFPTNSPPHVGYLNPPFNDGDTFYYFITARDVLGRDGMVSPPGPGEAYRLIPPQAPKNVQVENYFHVLNGGAGLTNQQCLRVSWPQDFDTNDQVNAYWIYRWPNPTMALTNGVAPTNHRVGIVAQMPGTNVNYFLDNGTNAPLTPGLSNYWYTVRAVSQAAIGPLASPNSPPAWGVLRVRHGPAGTTGEVIGSCGTPAVMFQSFNTISNSGPADQLHSNYRFTCQRRDPGVAWAEFFATNQLGGVDTIGPLYFPPDGDSISADYEVTVAVSNELVGVGCMVGTFYGEVSQPAFATFPSPPAPGQREEAVFYTGQLLLTALSPSDPLLIALNQGRSQCYTPYALAAFPDGMVKMKFDVLPGTPLMIQVSTNTGILAIWSNIGVVTSDSNNVYWVSYPDCMLGPLPPIRGCTLNLPAAGNCDQHVARAEPGGPVAPIRVRFRLTPRTHEYRVYRRANDGPFTLIAQGGSVYDPNNPDKIIESTDDAMPPSAARLCYYVQLLDRHGNGSPMSFIGCKEVKPAKLPRPVLASPQDAGSTNYPAVALDWFCPTSGVYRFQINIERADQPNSTQPSGLTSTNLTPLASYNANVRYAGLSLDPTHLTQFGEAQLTPPLDAGFGPGPKFTLTANVLPNVPYHISVAAMDDQGNAGEPSQVWTFVWKPPVTLPTVPWPARPLPPVTYFDQGQLGSSYIILLQPFRPRVHAVLLYGRTGLDQRYPVGIRIGGPIQITQTSQTHISSIVKNVGTTNFAGYSVTAYTAATFGSPPADPHTLIFRRESLDPTRKGQSLLPIAVYRMQVTNSVFTHVSGALTQVTPLLERIPYSFQTNSPTAGTSTVTIYDRLLAIGDETAPLFDTLETFLYLRDQQPVILGATYQYFVVRFNEEHEVSEIINAGTVNIPSSP